MQLSRIYRHPVKSVGSERLDHVSLETGKPFPHDRRYAITHAKSQFDASAPEWRPCGEFLRIVNIPELAAADVSFDPDKETMSISYPGAEPFATDLSTQEGRISLGEWAAGFAGTKVPGPYELIDLSGTSFTDSSRQVPSLMSLSSLNALSTLVGAPLDPRRFRGNLWIEGADPWAELDWVGRKITIGAVRLRVIEPIERCLATAADQ